MTAHASFPALGTTALVAVTQPRFLHHARILLDHELADFDLACSRFRDDSELSRVNRANGLRVAIGSTLHEALKVGLRAAEATDGLVDPTLGVELRNLGYDRTFALVQARDGWHVASRRPARRRWQEVDLSADPPAVRVPRDVELDLGATAKALAADRAATRISHELRTGVLISLGGDIAAAGSPPAGGWCVLISDIHTAGLDERGPRIVIKGGGLATSSTAGRRWRTDRGEAHHVIDPRSGASAVTPWRTVSVAAATCVDANVAATAALVLGHRAPAWLRRCELPARLVRTTGEALTVCGWPDESETTAW